MTDAEKAQLQRDAFQKGWREGHAWLKGWGRTDSTWVTLRDDEAGQRTAEILFPVPEVLRVAVLPVGRRFVSVAAARYSIVAVDDEGAAWYYNDSLDRPTWTEMPAHPGRPTEAGADDR